MARVILYADEQTDAIRNALSETARRRKIQMEYNEKHGITPTTIDKAIRDLIAELADAPDKQDAPDKLELAEDSATEDIETLIADLNKQMLEAAGNLKFERAAVLRDQLTELRRQLQEEAAKA